MYKVKLFLGCVNTGVSVAVNVALVTGERWQVIGGRLKVAGDM